MSNKIVNWLAQQCTVNDRQYLVVYLYINELQVHPVNNLVFDLNSTKWKQLSPFKESDAKIIDQVLNTKHAEIATGEQLKFVAKYLKKEKQRFGSYLKYHNSHLGEIFDWDLFAGKPLAYVFNGSPLTKIYQFVKLPNHDYQLAMPEELQFYDILTYLAFSERLLKKIELKNNLFIQVAQNMFFAVKPIKPHSDFVISICVYDLQAKRAKMYSNTLLKNCKMQGQADEKLVDEITADLNKFLTSLHKKSTAEGKAELKKKQQTYQKTVKKLRRQHSKLRAVHSLHRF